MNLNEYIKSKGLIPGTLSVEDYFSTMAEWSSWKFYPDFSLEDVNNNLLKVFKEEIIKKYTFLPLDVTDDYVSVIICGPNNTELTDYLTITYEKEIIYSLTYRSVLSKVISDIYDKQEYLEDINAIEVKNQSAIKYHSEEDLGDEDKVRKFLWKTVKDAIAERSSDIHIEPTRESVEIRFRVDGKLREYTSLNRNALDNLISTIKLDCNRDIFEKRKPQDGQMLYVIDGRNVNLRVSVINGIHGEGAVLRLLDSSLKFNSVKSLSLGKDEELIKDNLAMSNGLILVTGPTGSGKSTSLHAMISEIQDRGKVISVEDPVEIRHDGIMQTEINEKIGLDFSGSLRSILRHDPDIILVGEIRDSETASMALAASITGHLVLSTLHTNDAISTIERLVDMGVSKSIILEALNCIMSQRLVRKVCPYCGVEKQLPNYSPHRKLYGLDPEEPISYLEGTGCIKCKNEGYLGRILIKEVLYIDDSLRQALKNDVESSKLETMLRLKGFKSLKEDSLEKILAHETNFEEVRKYVIQN